MRKLSSELTAVSITFLGLKNTWFLKATCPVEKKQGNKYKLNCDAKVTGSSDNPVVADFVVYENRCEILLTSVFYLTL